MEKTIEHEMETGILGTRVFQNWGYVFFVFFAVGVPKSYVGVSLVMGTRP